MYLHKYINVVFKKISTVESRSKLIRKSIFVTDHSREHSLEAVSTVFIVALRQYAGAWLRDRGVCGQCGAARVTWHGVTDARQRAVTEADSWIRLCSARRASPLTPRPPAAAIATNCGATGAYCNPRTSPRADLCLYRTFVWKNNFQQRFKVSKVSLIYCLFGCRYH